MTNEAVSMTAEQFYALTQYRLDQLHWPGNEGRDITEVTMTINELQTIVAALQDIAATREGKNAPKRGQGDQVDIKTTKEEEPVPKLNQAEQTDIKATREGENRPKQDQEDQGERGNTEGRGKEGAQEQGMDEGWQEQGQDSESTDSRGEGDYSYLLANPRLAEAHDDNSTVVHHTGADRSAPQHNQGTNHPHSQPLSNQGRGKGVVREASGSTDHGSKASGSTKYDGEGYREETGGKEQSKAKAEGGDRKEGIGDYNQDKTEDTDNKNHGILQARGCKGQAINNKKENPDENSHTTSARTKSASEVLGRTNSNREATGPTNGTSKATGSTNFGREASGFINWVKETWGYTSGVRKGGRGAAGARPGR